MASTEIVPGIHVVRGKFAGEFGFIASYLVVDGDEALVIDPGTAGDPGEKRIGDAMDNLGLSVKRNITGIVCTHGHPDHAGGAGRLRRKSGAPIMIHEDDTDLLRGPQLFLKERLLMDRAQRLAMKLDKGPMRVNYKGLKPDRVLSSGDVITVGATKLKVIPTRGHSAGHCAFYDPEKKALFSGDEVNNFPNDPRKFYVDLSGSMVSKMSALDAISKLSIDYLLPSHDVPYLFRDVKLQIEAVKDGVVHLQDTVLSHLRAREEADIEQLVFDIRRARSVPVPETMDSLLSTTVLVTLRGLRHAGLVRDLGGGRWTKT
ncbi:MBL fold metallo-hydrolase [Candidatus Thorarchaeota archaeon]|nr:MAG: MBL fold metallo-hydrolase [Candidatus Thorarchaeota archaeon]